MLKSWCSNQYGGGYQTNPQLCCAALEHTRAAQPSSALLFAKVDRDRKWTKGVNLTKQVVWVDFEH